MIYYFSFGLLNICLLFILTHIYRRKTGIDLFPGRMSGDKFLMFLTILAYFLSGHYGTIAFVIQLLGILFFINRCK
jgi:hypothetical protein